MNILSFFHRAVGRKAASNRVASVFLAGVAFVVLQGFAIQKAYAHHPNISATASCSNGAAVITYTATSWDPGSTFGPPGDGDNPAIEILFNGNLVDTEPFLPSPGQIPPDQFTNTMTAPQGTNSVDVEAIAVSPWGDGYVPQVGDERVVTVAIPTDCAPGTGRFTGGGKQVTINLVDGNPLVVTKGFEVDCDLHQPSNNLEINWEGNQFHMTDFTDAVCTLVKKPNPPTAPVNTIVGKGTGRFDGADGFTVEFTLIDNGEPGTNDEAKFKIYETANPANVILETPLSFITGGNIQAHVDQH